MIHGKNDPHIWPRVGVGPGAGGFGMVAADSSRLRKAGEVQISVAFQTGKKPIRQAMQISEAPMSTIHGLMKFEIRNCGTAKDTPQTRRAGQIATAPRQPANAQISQNGTMSEKNGSCRPTMAPSREGSIPGTLAKPGTRGPRAPQADGAVLAINERPDAASGEKPSPIRIAPVTATGVPKPDAPSKNAPNAKAMSRSWSRRSLVTPPIVDCNVAKTPFSTVRR